MSEPEVKVVFSVGWIIVYTRDTSLAGHSPAEHGHGPDQNLWRPLHRRSLQPSLERSTAHRLMLAILNHDERFVELSPCSLQKLTLQSVKYAVMNQFVGGNMEVCELLFLSCISYFFIFKCSYCTYTCSNIYLINKFLCSFNFVSLFFAGQHCCWFHWRESRILCSWWYWPWFEMFCFMMI